MAKTIVRTHDYRDAKGELFTQVVRFEPKSFGQRRPIRPNGYAWGLAAGWYDRNQDGDYYLSKHASPNPDKSPSEQAVWLSSRT